MTGLDVQDAAAKAEEMVNPAFLVASWPSAASTSVPLS
jgi:hypothetical protein